jgi:hypothetical protein
MLLGGGKPRAGCRWSRERPLANSARLNIAPSATNNPQPLQPLQSMFRGRATSPGGIVLDRNTQRSSPVIQSSISPSTLDLRI